MTLWGTLLAGLAGLAACATVTSGDGPARPASDPSGPAARIVLERPPAGTDSFSVTAVYDGPADEALQYRLTVERQGAAGRSQSAQSGRFSPQGQGPATLSSVRVNAAPGDRLEIVLTVSRGADEIARDEHHETVADTP